jgi:8-oxo-dGTP diphosphatase
MMQKYVCGFCFTEARDRVLLIKKKRPKWQNGRLNGIGGHIEPNELEIQAMKREFWEETGISSNVRAIKWNRLAYLRGSGWEVCFFHAFSDEMAQAVTTTDEEIVELAVRDAMFDPLVLPNVPMLLALALMPDGYTARPVILYDVSPPTAYDY